MRLQRCVLVQRGQQWMQQGCQVKWCRDSAAAMDAGAVAVALAICTRVLANFAAFLRSAAFVASVFTHAKLLLALRSQVQKRGPKQVSCASVYKARAESHLWQRRATPQEETAPTTALLASNTSILTSILIRSFTALALR